MWNAEESRRLFRILVELRNAGDVGTIDWMKVENMYNSQSSQQRRFKQMMNHYNSCKAKWLAWTDLNRMTGIAFTEDRLPTQDELRSDRLQEFIQKHRTGGAGNFVCKNRLPDLDLWNPIFDGRCATGNISISPALAKAQRGKAKLSHMDMDPVEEGSGDSDDVHLSRGAAMLSDEDCCSRSPPRTGSSKK